MLKLLAPLLGLALGSSALALDAPTAPEAATGRYALSQATATRAMAVSANPYATDAALRMLKRGGSAVDAAIAAQAVLGLVEPQSSGFGGGVFIVYYDGKQAQSFDGRETAPAATNKDWFLNEAGKPLAFYSAMEGGHAVGVPGAVAALAAAHKQHGRLPWKTLLQPAIALAENGFPVSPRLHALIAQDPLLKQHESTRAYFFDASGEPWPVGHALKNPAYAKTLKQLAQKNGAQDFYRGAFAKSLSTELQAAGSPITAQDLAGYQAKITAALCDNYHRYRLCTAPPPSGGWTVLQTLKILEGLPVDAKDANNADTLHRLLETERLSFADRQQYSADPTFIPLPLAGLLSADYLQERRALIGEQSLGTAKPGVPPGLVPPWGPDGQLLENGTSQIVIADARGHWLSMTTSIEDAFGSRLIVQGLLMNNQLTDFSFQPVQNGHPVANRLEPGKRSRSAMSPVLVFDENGKPVMALGSPGGSRIIGYVTRVLVASLDQQLLPAQAVALPHALSRNGASELETGTDTAVIQALEARGHSVKTGEMNSGLALIRRYGKTLQGAADPRREGRAAGY